MEALMRGVLLCTLALGVLASGQKMGRLEVATQYGKLRGKTLSVKGTERTVHAFYGIPFAKPPIGALRFAAPEPPEAWSSTREASEYAAVCLQDPHKAEQVMKLINMKYTLPPMSEDCLYLNIYTPADRVKGEKLPVMLYIHGGGLVSGGASMFDGSALSAYEHIVVVSIQYRLGILGFFSTGDDRAPGNYGFLDQVAALWWVQVNIADFGGDPNSVTIFGVSSGGMSVSALVASPLAKGLFHRAIAESGVAIVEGFVANSTEQVLFHRNDVANSSGCAVDTIVDCLKTKSEEEILSMKVMALPATIDGMFFPKPVEQILAEKEANSVPFLTGVTNHEYGWIIPLARLNAGLLQEEKVLHKEPEYYSILNHMGKVCDSYPPGSIKMHACISNEFGDFIFVIPALKVAKYHRDSGHPTYFYEFQHRPSLYKGFKPDYVKADHGDELLFVMGGPFLESDFLPTDSFNKEEKNLSKTVMKYWANFARTGNPNGPGLVHWPLYDQDEGYMEINLEQRAAKQLKAEKYEYWTKVLLQEEKKHTEL